MLVEVLKKYLNKETINASYDEALLKVSLEQSLQTILYPVFELEEYKKYYISWAIKQEMFYSLQNEITSIFNKNQIKHVYFKGSVVSKYYDDPSVRTRGDIDLYVSLEDFHKAEDVLKENGYLVDTTVLDCSHHTSFKKNNIEIELHFNMFDSDVKKSWIKLFKEPFMLCDVSNEYLYEYKDTYHFIYSILHFAHHLRHGAGIRYMLDFYYMLKKTNIDFEILHKLVDELDIKVLYENIINTLYYLSGIKFDDVSEYDIKFFIDYMMSYGIHGHSNNDTSVMASVHENKIKYAFNRIFLINKNYRRTRYRILGAHWYLYPLCLIKHWIYLVTHKMGSFFKFLFGKNKNKKLYKKLGV